jgi:hypothetical protein
LEREERREHRVTVGFEDPKAEGPGPAAPDEGSAASAPRRERLLATVVNLVNLIRSSDEAAVEKAILQLSESRRWLAPLALIIGAFLLLFRGLKLLVTNWRLSLVQIIPAMWIWAALLDIKIHLLHGREFNVIRGPILIPCFIVITGITAASFYLNGVFAFAISDNDGPPQIRPSFAKANDHLRTILAWGGGIGLALSFSTLISSRWGHLWFALCQGIVVGVMMLCYLAVPARMVGVTKIKSRRDSLATTAIGGAVGAVVCSPPYLIGRLGILMLGWRYLFWAGILLIVIGAALQTGVTSAVKAVKFSAKLVGNPSLAESSPSSSAASAAPASPQT